MSWIQRFFQRLLVNFRQILLGASSMFVRLFGANWYINQEFLENDNQGQGKAI